MLTFDRPESGANIFDAATMREPERAFVDSIENESSLKGVIVTSAKKSIFIAGADLQTLLRQAQTGEMRDFIAEGQQRLQSARRAQDSDVRGDSWRVCRRRLRGHARVRLPRRIG